jgi:hypothetical protein
LRNLTIQNQCLLLKLLHRIHTPGDSSWVRWIRSWVDVVTMAGPDAVGVHWNSVRALLPTYRAITTVTLCNGRSTSSWDDIWSPAGCLANALLALLSNCTDRGVSVHAAITAGLRHYLVHRGGAA